ncbi:hypothetical protein K438DRAFT_1945953 [Mycena galopus ATCC 62051]|nr:hypothetical protein K438DRAFT_1945953 [Mycena galopus ATCC 62051]
MQQPSSRLSSIGKVLQDVAVSVKVSRSPVWQCEYTLSATRYPVEAENFTIFQIHSSGPEQQQQMNSSEIQQSNAALALVRCPPPSQIFQGQQDILEKIDEYFITIDARPKVQRTGESFTIWGEMGGARKIDDEIVRGK